jgi:hypothetical protein
MLIPLNEDRAGHADPCRYHCQKMKPVAAEDPSARPREFVPAQEDVRYIEHWR